MSARTRHRPGRGEPYQLPGFLRHRCAERRLAITVLVPHAARGDKTQVAFQQAGRNLQAAQRLLPLVHTFTGVQERGQQQVAGHTDKGKDPERHHHFQQRKPGDTPVPMLSAARHRGAPDR